MDPCDFIGMQRDSGRRVLMEGFRARFGHGVGRSADDYDWEPGDEGVLVLIPSEAGTATELNAVFAGWLCGGPCFRLVPDYGRFYCGTLALPDLSARLAGDRELDVGFRGQRLPRGRCSFWPGRSISVGGRSFELDVAPAGEGDEFLVVHCGLGLPRESFLDEVLG